MYDIETFNTYQRLAKETANYPPEHETWYLALGLTGEAGEVANKIKKQIRDGANNRDAVIEELGDVLWYVAMLARSLNVDLSIIATENINKLRDRYQIKEMIKRAEAEAIINPASVEGNARAIVGRITKASVEVINPDPDPRQAPMEF